MSKDQFINSKVKMLQGYANIANQWSGRSDPNKNYPELVTGSRVHIMVSGNPIAVALNVTWSVQHAYEEIRTIDSNLPWDIAIGQSTVRATLRTIIDPRTSAETEGIFTTMAASIHQPLVELKFIDACGEVLFLSRGMFVGMQNNIAVGGMGERSVEFVGVLYAHNVAQRFDPYPTGTMSEVVKDKKKLNRLVKLTGGLL